MHPDSRPFLPVAVATLAVPAASTPNLGSALRATHATPITAPVWVAPE